MTGPVLVTGGGGFLGGRVVRRLLGQSRAVRALDLSYPPDFPARAERVEGSILDPAALERACDGVSGIVHCAAIAHLWTRDARDYERVNVGGAKAVLDAARRAGVRMALVSSFTTLVAADTPPGATLDESREHDPERLLGPYPASKRRAELAARAAAEAGLDVAIVLPCAPVGPGDRSMTPPTRMIADLAAGRTPALIDTLLNLADADALADGIVAALDRGARGRRYLLAGEDVPMRDLAERIAAISGVRAPRAVVPIQIALLAARVEAVVSAMSGRAPTAPLTGVRIAARRVRFDATRAREELGFAPPPLEHALRRSIGWLRTQGKA